MNDPQPTKSNIELLPWDESDWPIAWLWIQEFWHVLADDFHPKDLETFIEVKKRGGARCLGVHCDDEFGGLIVWHRRSSVVAVGHCVFKRSFHRRSITVPALKRAMEIVWQEGYQKIACPIFPDNHAIARLLLAVGARREAVLLRETLRDGKFQDMQSYALLKSRMNN